MHITIGIAAVFIPLRHPQLQRSARTEPNLFFSPPDLFTIPFTSLTTQLIMKVAEQPWRPSKKLTKKNFLSQTQRGDVKDRAELQTLQSLFNHTGSRKLQIGLSEDDNPQAFWQISAAKSQWDSHIHSQSLASRTSYVIRPQNITKVLQTWPHRLPLSLKFTGVFNAHFEAFNVL
eukprot:18267-Heterococcus_DN1.PRE.3